MTLIKILSMGGGVMYAQWESRGRGDLEQNNAEGFCCKGKQMSGNEGGSKKKKKKPRLVEVAVLLAFISNWPKSKRNVSGGCQMVLTKIFGTLYKSSLCTGLT